MAAGAFPVYNPLESFVTLPLAPGEATTYPLLNATNMALGLTPSLEVPGESASAGIYPPTWLGKNIGAS